MSMEDIIEDAVEMVSKAFEQEDVSLFVGAGISLENPANLPSARELMKEILNYSISRPPKYFNSQNSQDLLEQYLSSQSLELMVQDLIDVHSDFAVDVLDVFKCGEPNVYHFLIAKLANLGFISRLFTTNFDTLVEKALDIEGVRYNIFETDNDFADYLVSPEKYTYFHVYKLHGSVAFTKSAETAGRKPARALSKMKFQMYQRMKYLEKQGIKTHSIGFERTVSTKDSLIGSLSRVGIELSEYTYKVLKNSLGNSTFVIIGWNGFDLDISPLLFDSEKKIYWMVHTEKTIPNTETSEKETEAKEIEQILKSNKWDPESIKFALLSTGHLLPGELPSPEREREQIISRCGGKSFELYTPQFIRKLWDKLSLRIGPFPILQDKRKNIKKDINEVINKWCESMDTFFTHWFLAKFMLNKGEYETTISLLIDLIEHIHNQGYYDIESLIYLDLGELHSYYGNKKDANQCFRTAIRLFEESIQGQFDKLSGFFHARQLMEIPERAYFEIGVLAQDFFQLKEAEKAFGKMPIEEFIVKPLVHFCQGEFKESIRLLEKIDQKYKRRGNTKFHYYLYYFLKLLHADIATLFYNYDYAYELYNIVLDTTVKTGWPRHQVRALLGLAKIHSSSRKHYDLFLAAKCATHAIEISKSVEYRTGKAFSGYIFGLIYVAKGMNDIAERSFRVSERLFKAMGNDVGRNLCLKEIGDL